jgi:hypothetical protein
MNKKQKDTLDQLEMLFAVLCEKSIFPQSVYDKWTYLLPSHLTNCDVSHFSYFETEEEASNAAFYRAEFPRVIFTGKIENKRKEK